MDQNDDLERAHPSQETSNVIFRQNMRVFEYFDKHEDERRYFMMNAIAHQTLFVLGMLFTCGYLVSNKVLMMILFEENPVKILIVVFSIFCLFCLFCTRSLRYSLNDAVELFRSTMVCFYAS